APLPAAGRAHCRLAPRLGAAARARFTDVEARELDLALTAAQHNFECDRDFSLKVVPADHRTLPAASARPSGESAAAEDVLKHREDVVDVHAAEVVRGSALPAHTLVPELVVARTLLRIAEHLI